MQNLVQFSFQNHPVRVVMIDGEPWWVAKDVCDVLGLENTSLAINGRPDRQDSGLDPDEKGIASVNTPGGTQEMWVVNEPGLYSLVFKSRRDEAKEFRRWVRHDVLPSIRKHGMYAVDELLDDPEHLLRVTQKLVEERKARLVAEAQVKELAPKAEFADAIASSDDCQSIGEIAKILQTGQNRLFRWLRGERILMADNLPYQEYLDSGYFRVIEQKWQGSGGKVNLATKTLVTGRGLLWLQKRYQKGA